MKFYDCHVAPNPRRARMFLAEKGIELEKIEIDILGGENLGDDFLAINPRGLLPVLELDDGTRIDEVMAICRYFEELQPEPAMFGRDLREKAIITSRQRKMEFDGMISSSEVFRNQNEQFCKRSIPGGGKDDIPAIPALIDRGQQTLDRFFWWLESYLEEGPYLAGEYFTMVDITAICAVDFAAWSDIHIPEANVRTKSWYEAISARPSAEA
ncbi:MAG: glutathione S-transferase family protein [Gammaproteobacteria bacterium]|nr:MAG: glutathione S-transferase family protein [Gammaproteobacteria bacterium]